MGMRQREMSGHSDTSSREEQEKEENEDMRKDAKERVKNRRRHTSQDALHQNGKLSEWNQEGKQQKKRSLRKEEFYQLDNQQELHRLIKSSSLRPPPCSALPPLCICTPLTRHLFFFFYRSLVSPPGLFISLFLCLADFTTSLLLFRQLLSCS